MEGRVTAEADRCGDAGERTRGVVREQVARLLEPPPGAPDAQLATDLLLEQSPQPPGREAADARQRRGVQLHAGSPGELTQRRGHRRVHRPRRRRILDPRDQRLPGLEQQPGEPGVAVVGVPDHPPHPPREAVEPGDGARWQAAAPVAPGIGRTQRCSRGAAAVAREQIRREYRDPHGEGRRRVDQHMVLGWEQKQGAARLEFVEPAGEQVARATGEDQIQLELGVAVAAPGSATIDEPDHARVIGRQLQHLVHDAKR